MMEANNMTKLVRMMVKLMFTMILILKSTGRMKKEIEPVIKTCWDGARTGE